MLMYYDARPSVFNGVFDLYTYEKLKTIMLCIAAECFTVWITRSPSKTKPGIYIRSAVLIKTAKHFR